MAREVEEAAGENLAVGDHDRDVGLEGVQFPGEGFARLAPEAVRLEDRQAMGQGTFLDRWRFQLSPAPRRLVRLAYHRQHFVGGFHQPVERRHGEVRGAEKDDAQQEPPGRE